MDESAPLYALEHVLSVRDLILLRSAVQESIRLGFSDLEYWMPFVDYAAEVGYDYSGVEFWNGFEAAPPGWTN